MQTHLAQCGTVTYIFFYEVKHGKYAGHMCTHHVLYLPCWPLAERKIPTLNNNYSYLMYMYSCTV